MKVVVDSTIDSGVLGSDSVGLDVDGSVDGRLIGSGGSLGHMQ